MSHMTHDPGLRKYQGAVARLWNHYCTVANESLSMLFICSRHLEKASISEISKIFIFGVIYRKFDQVRQVVPIGSRRSGEALVNIGQVIIVG